MFRKEICFLQANHFVIITVFPPQLNKILRWAMVILKFATFQIIWSVFEFIALLFLHHCLLILRLAAGADVGVPANVGLFGNFSHWRGRQQRP
jgi:hypothetical protein